MRTAPRANSSLDRQIAALRSKRDARFAALSQPLERAGIDREAATSALLCAVSSGPAGGLAATMLAARLRR